MLKRTKNIDKKLVELVRMSKYDGGKYKKIHSHQTQLTLECSMPDIKLNTTAMDEYVEYRSLHDIRFFEEEA